MTSDVLTDLEGFCLLLQRLNRALALADTQTIFHLVGEIGEKTKALEQVEVFPVDDTQAARLKSVAERIRSIQEANQELSNNGLRTARWCAQLLQPSPAYSADGTMPESVAGIFLSA